MIKNIVFDMGNVLIKYDPSQFIEEFTSNEKHQQMLLEKIFYTDEWEQYDQGTITKEEIIDKATSLLPKVLHSSIPVVMDTWFEKMTPISGMEDVVKILKKNGYSIYLLSNVSQDFYSFRDVVPGIDYFDGKFISSDWKCIKPDAEIYQLFFSYFNLEPAECFFIDDLAINIEAAASQGMQGHIFDGNISKMTSSLNTEGVMI
ncbi:MAG: HAD family phosphatase [Staphylococcus equorum]|uniref:HAD family hydrolase n=1 Tax=Tetragenococcus koreensis TaxID=290335 RepID=UPI001F4545D9|nr:HAD family phosphatase [Tetragenococcus koreensis]MDN6570434.1 HAD family phosphatase [Staphylococcus equorum]MCF1615233.1 HAD family phosphatase [Tetragenococcus koreensis]MCF1625011.1 HAD family phosphatase [Tetragenococcus koreensis]MCF1627728.1 HAD family phosphatase [Tetragenococcus koreensis]MCF1678163.1 HAD family phosphatase [Tetragenococcus koreensis]